MHKINIGTNAEQFTPEYLKINPNGKIPSIVDPDGPGRQADRDDGVGRDPDLPRREDEKVLAREKNRYQVLQWLMFQMGGVGPMFGQAHHFMRAKKDEIPYGSERYGNEAKRLYGVMDAHLAKNEFFAGRVLASPTSPSIPGRRATSGTAWTSPRSRT